MDLTAFNSRDLQNLQAVLTTAMQAGETIQVLAAALDRELQSRQQSLSAAAPAPAKQRRSDNVTICSICGKPAVIVPLSRSDRSTAATHAVQCQNRPATDHPWRNGMCGHTEYVVRGER